MSNCLQYPGSAISVVFTNQGDDGKEDKPTVSRVESLFVFQLKTF